MRQRYLAHYRTILNETFTTANANAIIDEINTQISALVAADPKKLYTTAQYTSGVPALKTIVANRRNYLMNNTEVAQVAPVIASAPYYNSAMAQYTIPTANEVANIQTTVSHASGLNKVNLYYATGLLGNFTVAQMFDDGAHNDGAAADGVYGAQIPGYAANTLVRYYVEAIANNATLSAAYLPVGAEHDIFVYTVQETIATNGVVINEILSSNTADAIDEAGDHEDWVELYNNNDIEVDLSGFYLSDDVTDLDKWQFPAGSVIPANGYMIVWADNEAAEGPLHAAWKISVSGESVTLSDAAMNVVDQVIFGAQQVDMGYARIPNGTGDFVIQASTFNANNEDALATTSFVKSDTFAVYPNPASDVVTIAVNSDFVGQKAELFNALGQKVSETTLSEQTPINTGHLSKGVYLVRIGTQSKKLIIQ
ncbi:lamin tail domain-containing protein [Flavobacterium sp.]|uniref:lamin tail domain-containing protein n=1 Tax=Flavobacterium sp. TaxID=239 RepID=UPI0039E49E41